MIQLDNPTELISRIPKVARVFIHGGAATPNVLLSAICEHPDLFEHLEFLHLHTIGPAIYRQSRFQNKFSVSNLFVGSNMRDSIVQPHVDYLPCFLSEIPKLFRSGRRKLDVALVQVSPPDAHGYCSLGTSVDVARAAVDSADLVFAQINPLMPRVLGDGIIHQSQIHASVHIESPLPTSEHGELRTEEQKIGEHIAGLVPDGATLQVGIGTIPEAALKALKHHKNLGIHTETWSDGVMELIQSGALNNSQKTIHPGKSVASFGIGSQKFYDFIHDNPSVLHLDASYVNNPAIIARNKKVVAINSAVEIDLTGQVCADSIGSRIISGVGGQMDFIRGASLSEGGMPIIAITSRTQKGYPRIVPQLKSGAGVVTTRAHVHFVVTEHGIVDLYGQTLKERARALIQLAHPEDREYLDNEFHRLLSHN